MSAPDRHVAALNGAGRPQVAPVAVAVMAKEPIAGRVKTRLCPPCTPEQAARIALACLQDTLDAVAAARVRRRIVVLDGESGSWLPDGFEVIPQSAGELSVRLGAAVAAVGEPVLVIGMDTPQVTGALLDEASATLGSPGVDAVLGPASDGGFWLLGVRDPDPRCVAGVPMSRPDTLARQRRRLAQRSLEVVEVRELRDVDTIDDAIAVAREHPCVRLVGLLAEAGLLVP